MDPLHGCFLVITIMDREKIRLFFLAEPVIFFYIYKAEQYLRVVSEASFQIGTGDLKVFQGAGQFISSGR